MPRGWTKETPSLSLNKEGNESGIQCRGNKQSQSRSGGKHTAKGENEQRFLIYANKNEFLQKNQLFLHMSFFCCTFDQLP